MNTQSNSFAPMPRHACSIRRGWQLWLAVPALLMLTAACSKTDLPTPAPTIAATATIRISGSPADRVLLKSLEQGFRAKRPDIAFEYSLYGPESTMAGVYTGTADIAWMGRELREPMERMAFEWVMLDKPLAIEIANAGIDSNRDSTQLGVFVHRSNPLQQLSLRQLDAIYGAEHRRGVTNIRQWGELGLDQEWSGRPIHVYGPKVDSVQALHLRRIVLNDSRKWNPGYQQTDEGAAVTAALAADPVGIAYAPLRDANAEVKLVALAVDDGGPFHLPDVANIQARTWPLVRSISVVTAHTTAHPMRDEVREFLAHVLSAEGQALIEREGGYLPLGDETLRAQRERLP